MNVIMAKKYSLKHRIFTWVSICLLLKMLGVSSCLSAQTNQFDCIHPNRINNVATDELLPCVDHDSMRFFGHNRQHLLVSKNGIHHSNQKLSIATNSDHDECIQKLSHADLTYSTSTFFENVSLIKWETAVVAGSTLMLGFMDWDWGSSSFFFDSEGYFGKDTISGGMDKLGHIYGSYTRADCFTYSINRKSGNLEQAALTGSMMSWGTMLMVETMDGFSGDHGFSPEDIVMNTIGVAISYLRNTNPKIENKLDFRLEYSPSGYDREFSPHSDYAGQKYLLALKLGGFEKMEETPLRYFEIQAGYFTEGFNGDEAIARDIDASRHLFVGVGINLEELLFGRDKQDESMYKFAGRQFLQRIQIPYTYYTYDDKAYHY